MLSDRKQDEQKQGRPRVLKSHQVVGTGYAFPMLEQVAERDLPPSLSAGCEPGTRQTSSVTQSDAERRLAEAREAEERARAVERRAAAFLAEAEETVAARLRETETQMDQMLSRTAAAIDEIEAETREKAYKSGHADGYQVGLDAAQPGAEALMQQARQEANAITAAARTQAEQTRVAAVRDRQELLDCARLEVLDLAFAMARQVLKAEAVLRPEAMLPMLEAALSKLKGEEEPLVRVSPAVLALLDAERGRLLAALPGARRLALEPDPALKPGDFVVQGAQGVVDGRLDSQVKVIAESIRDEER